MHDEYVKLDAWDSQKDSVEIIEVGEENGGKSHKGGIHLSIKIRGTLARGLGSDIQGYLQKITILNPMHIVECI